MDNLFDLYPHKKAILVDGVAGGGKTTLLAGHAEGCIRAKMNTLLITHSKAGMEAMFNKLSEWGIYAKVQDHLNVSSIDVLAERTVYRLGDRRFRMKKEYVEQVMLAPLLDKAVGQLEGKIETAPSVTPKSMKRLMRDLDSFRSSGAYLKDDLESAEDAVAGKIDFEFLLVYRVFALYEDFRRTWQPTPDLDWKSGLENAQDAMSAHLFEGFRCEGEAVSDLIAHEKYQSWQCDERQVGRYKYVLIDEFHDTTPLQLIFLSDLCRRAIRVLAVGDKHQNIYAWRGSDPDFVYNEFNQIFQPEIVPIHVTYRFGNRLANLLGSFTNRQGWVSQTAWNTKINFSHQSVEELIRECFADHDFTSTALVCRDEATLISMLFDGVDTIDEMRSYISYPIADCFASRIITFLCSLHLPKVGWAGRGLHDSVREFMSLPQCICSEEVRAAMQREIIQSLSSERGVRTDEFISTNIVTFVSMQLAQDNSEKQQQVWFTSAMKKALSEWVKASQEQPLDVLLEAFETQSGFLKMRIGGRNQIASELMVKSWGALLRYIEKHKLKVEDWPKRLIMLNRICRENRVLQVRTIEQIKGLQFRKVVLYGLNDGEFPAGYDGLLERNRFYVAASRAMQELTLHADKVPGKFFRKAHEVVKGTPYMK